MSTLRDGGLGTVFICMCLCACLGKNAKMKWGGGLGRRKKNLHLKQRSSMHSLGVLQEDESHSIKFDRYTGTTGDCMTAKEPFQSALL